MKIYVLARNQAHYIEWLKKHFHGNPRDSRFEYVYRTEQLIGVTDPIILKVGNWHDNRTIGDIQLLYELMDRNTSKRITSKVKMYRCNKAYRIKECVKHRCEHRFLHQRDMTCNNGCCIVKNVKCIEKEQ